MQKPDQIASLKHIQYLRLFFNTIGAWPSELFEKKSRRKVITYAIIILGFTISIPGEVVYLWRKFHTLGFLDLVDVLTTLCLSLLTVAHKVVPSLKSYGNLVKDFITEFHLVNFQDKGGHYVQIFHKMLKVSNYFTVFMLSMSLMGPISFNTVCLYNNYKNGAFGKNMSENYTLQYSVYYIHPWWPEEEDGFIKKTILNWFLSYTCGVFVCGLNLLMTLMAFQIIGHISVLQHGIRDMPRPKNPSQLKIFHQATNTNVSVVVEMFDVQENIIIKRKIIEFVDHHRLIVRFAESVSSMFGPLIALIYLFDLVTCSFLLLVCSLLEMNTITRFGTITLIVFYQLIQISITFEYIRSESDKLIDQVYDTPWESMNVSNQKLMCIFFRRVQSPIRITALGMVEVGVQAMASILKTTISYFTLLRSVGD